MSRGLLAPDASRDTYPSAKKAISLRPYVSILEVDQISDNPDYRTTSRRCKKQWSLTQIYFKWIADRGLLHAPVSSRLEEPTKLTRQRTGILSNKWEEESIMWGIAPRSFFYQEFRSVTLDFVMVLFWPRLSPDFWDSSFICGDRDFVRTFCQHLHSYTQNISPKFRCQSRTQHDMTLHKCNITFHRHCKLQKISRQIYATFNSDKLVLPLDKLYRNFKWRYKQIYSHDNGAIWIKYCDVMIMLWIRELMNNMKIPNSPWSHF